MPCRKDPLGATSQTVASSPIDAVVETHATATAAAAAAIEIHAPAAAAANAAAIEIHTPAAATAAAAVKIPPPAAATAAAIVQTSIAPVAHPPLTCARRAIVPPGLNQVLLVHPVEPPRHELTQQIPRDVAAQVEFESKS